MQSLPTLMPAESSPDFGEECVPEDPRIRRIRRVATILAPGLVFLVVREFGVLVLALCARAGDLDLVEALTTWDGQWYLGIATGGYADTPEYLLDAYGRQTAETPLAFFPGYPTVIRWLAEVPGLSPSGAALFASTAFGVLAAYALARLGRLVRGGSDRAGYALVALFAAAPMGVVLSMAYSESMFCALAAWSLVFALERRWLWAAGGCVLAGLVRPTAVALVVTVAAAALAHALRAEAGVRSRACAAAAVLIAPLGLFGYLSWTGDWIRPASDWLERMTSWTQLQEAGWGSHFDGGVELTRFVVAALARADPERIATVAVVVGALVLLVFAFRRRLEWPLLGYSVAVLVMTLGSAGLMSSKARLLLAAFTLLLPPALALARCRTVVLTAVLGAAAVASSWFGVYALIFWENAI